MSRENAVIRYLEENGPAPKDELPRQPGRTDRRGGVASFKPFHLSYTTIFYLFESHSPAEVVDVYIQANPEVLEDRSMQELIPAVGDYGSDWKAAITDVLDENDQLQAAWQATDGETEPDAEPVDTQSESEETGATGSGDRGRRPMGRNAFKVGGMLLLVGGFVIAGGLYQPGPEVLWTGDACPQPGVTCGTLPLGVIGAIAAGVVAGGVVFGRSQEVGSE